MAEYIIVVASFSTDYLRVLDLLAHSKSVLLTGAPGTGKSKLLAEIATTFESVFSITPMGGTPTLDPIKGIPIPPSVGMVKKIPAPNKQKREVFGTVFHQSSKYRDFISGITPAANKAAGAPDFAIARGTLYCASEHAKQVSGAALLVIDEVNGGPAVQVFGGATIALKSDKRLSVDGVPRTEAQFFEILSSISGSVIECTSPHDLYVLAVMNQTDASVEPLDVTFLRHWEPLRLEPDESILRAHHGLGTKNIDALSDLPGSKTDVLEASVRAWVAINEQVSLGRGPELQIGHGALISDVELQGLALPEAPSTLYVGWAKARARVGEVLFEDPRGVATVLNALDGPSFNPLKLTETTFAGDLRFKLEGPTNFTEGNIYAALRSFTNSRG